MSFLETISADTVDRLTAEVPEFRRVLLIGAPSEFEELSLNPPTAAVVCTRVSNSDTPTPPGEEYVYVTVEIWYTATRFGIDQRQSGLSGNDGVYDLQARVHEAMKGWTPGGGCTEPMRFIESDVTDLSEGLVIAYTDYRTALVI